MSYLLAGIAALFGLAMAVVISIDSEGWFGPPLLWQNLDESAFLLGPYPLASIAFCFMSRKPRQYGVFAGLFFAAALVQAFFVRPECRYLSPPIGTFAFPGVGYTVHATYVMWGSALAGAAIGLGGFAKRCFDPPRQMPKTHVVIRSQNVEVDPKNETGG